jgi:hypothetical protein
MGQLYLCRENAMKRFACLAILLLSPVLLSTAAAQANAPSTTGLWKIDGNMMGQPVRMMCALTETKHNLSGVCSGAEDGYAAHKITGSVKAQKMQFYFQTAIGGNPLTVIVSGTLNEDRTKMDGDMDIEPMAAQAGLATGNESATGAGAAVDGATESNPSSAQPLATGTWKIDGNVMGNPVTMTCVLTEADHKLAGSCSGAGEGSTPRALTGTATPKGVNWRFDDQFQGQPISFSMIATLAADGAKMNGTISVAPMNVDGTFIAVKQ